MKIILALLIETKNRYSWFEFNLYRTYNYLAQSLLTVPNQIFMIVVITEYTAVFEC